jgi:Uncharacterized protein with SCP/PR1 domains
MRKKSYKVVKKLLMTCLALVFILQFYSKEASAATTIPVTISGTEHHAMAWDILTMVNAERTAAGVMPLLVMDIDLLDYGMLRAAECVVDYSHTRPDGSNIYIDMPGFGAGGENIAVGHPSAAAVMNGWMNSQGHKDNILNPAYSSIGIGVYFAEGRYYYAQVFRGSVGTPALATSTPVANTITTNISVNISAPAAPSATITAGTPKTFNLAVGQQVALDLPDIYISKSPPWSMRIKVDPSFLDWEIADPSVATIVGTNLQTADIKAVNGGSTTLKVFMNGQNAKAVSFPITISGHSHTYVSNIVAPTCAVAGYTQHTCSVCGDSYTDTPTTALGHNYTVTDTKAPTCGVAGYTEYTCGTCAHSYQDSIAPLAHIYTAMPSVAPTCTAEGYTEEVCATCTDTKRTSIPALGHTYVTMAPVAPTCTTDGYTPQECSVCSHTNQDAVVPALGHSYVSTVITTPTPCMPGGYTEHTCSDCGDTYQESTLPAVHTYVSTVVAPTCTTNGYTQNVCSVCAHTFTDNVIPPRHAYVSTVVAPTCTVDGYTGHVCSDCGDTYQDSIVSAAHDYQSTIVLAATCTTDGLTEHECSVCGDKLADTIIPAHGHVFGDWIVVNEGETTQTQERVCVHDGTVERREVSKVDTSNPPAQANANTGGSGSNQGGGGITAGSKAAATGDVADMALFAIGGIGAIAIIGFVIVRNKRMKNKQNNE